MRIGIPRELKTREGRVALVPAACSTLVSRGHRVLVEAGAGLASGYPDEAYRGAGAEVIDGPEAVYAQSELLVKVKEPVAEELARLRPDHLLFCYLHLAALPELTRALLEIGLTAVGFEVVREDGGLPLLAPMSQVAGRLAVQIGAHLLHQTGGGKGLLLGGVPGTPRGHVVVLGGGTAGGNAAALASGLGTRVTVFDRGLAKLEGMRALGPNVTGLYPYPQLLAQAVAEADLLIGAVLVPGARTPRLVDAGGVASMEPGSVIIDVSVDQGGCIETIRPTSYDDPTYVDAGVVHFGVTNMPGAVPRSASQALSAALTPYVLALAEPDWRERVPALAGAIYLEGGRPARPDLIGVP